MELSYISGNGTFSYFGQGIFRTLAYSEPGIFRNRGIFITLAFITLVHCQTSTMERFANIVTYSYL